MADLRIILYFVRWNMAAAISENSLDGFQYGWVYAVHVGAI